MKVNRQECPLYSREWEYSYARMYCDRGCAQECAAQNSSCRARKELGSTGCAYATQEEEFEVPYWQEHCFRQ